ncbi:hypothetical protein BOTBODRAFT_618817 [Botryobasidium botryosum FD-172 SS1]|uniref:Uncharacterized protein n=1 Tax=Botryobasidium botryosum (strain FD-172 SS1) TaxID=930990 RepID=A0A067NCR8_BOTB1|nr:hypothetical protein BOTBODRAFT_618817 [Botryobasidium botryosum FD-172 SS1]
MSVNLHIEAPDGLWLQTPSAPLADIRRLCRRPLKWLRFASYAICEAHTEIIPTFLIISTFRRILRFARIFGLRSLQFAAAKRRILFFAAKATVWIEAFRSSIISIWQILCPIPQVADAERTQSPSGPELRVTYRLCSLPSRPGRICARNQMDTTIFRRQEDVRGLPNVETQFRATEDPQLHMVPLPRFHVRRYLRMTGGILAITTMLGPPPPSDESGGETLEEISKQRDASTNGGG